MTILRTIIAFGLLFIIGAGCTKTIIDDVFPQLEVVVKSETGQFVSGATVWLFDTEDNWKVNKNSIISALTNEQGSALFVDLAEIRYYFFVEKDSMNNVNQISEIIEPLKVNVRAIVEITIK